MSKVYDSPYKYILSVHSNSVVEVSFESTIAMKTIELETNLDESEILKVFKYAYDNKIKVKDLEDFNEIVDSIGFDADRNNKQHRLIIPVNCKLRNRKFEFLGRDYKVYTNRSVLKKYRNISFKDYRKSGLPRQKINTHQKFFIETSVNGKNVYDCILKLYKDLECLSGFVNLILDRNLARINFGRKTNEALFDFGTIIYSISDDENSFIHWNRKTIGITATRALYIPDEIQAKNIMVGFRKATNLSKRNGSFDQLIANVMVLYYRAKTSIENENEFIYYWRTCENVVQSESLGGDTRKVLKRVQQLTKFNERFGYDISKIFSKLSSIRNNYVHRGDISFDVYYTSIMGMLSNELIFWLIDNRNFYNDEIDLMNMLKYISQSNKEINSKLQALKIISNNRKIRPTLRHRQPR